MKKMKRIAALTACAAIATSMAAGATYQSTITQIKPINIGTLCGNVPSQALDQLLHNICGNVVVNCPVTPNIKPGDSGQTPILPTPGEDATPETPNIKPEDSEQTPVVPSPDEDATPEIPNIKPEDPGQTPVVPNPDEGNKPETPEETPDNSLSAYTTEVVRLVNEERAKAGLSALKIDTKVQSAAQIRAVEINKNFSHTRPDGSSCFTALKEVGASYSGAGENIAYGQKSPAQVMQSWMNSSGHRANIMNEKFTTIGVGVAEIDGQLYWTQLFTY